MFGDKETIDKVIESLYGLPCYCGHFKYQHSESADLFSRPCLALWREPYPNDLIELGPEMPCPCFGYDAATYQIKTAEVKIEQPVNYCFCGHSKISHGQDGFCYESQEFFGMCQCSHYLEKISDEFAPAGRLPKPSLWQKIKDAVRKYIDGY